MSTPPRPVPIMLRSVEGVRMGHLTGQDSDRTLLVELDERRGSPVRARSLLTLSLEELDRAIREQQPAAFLFEGGDPTRPLLIGLVQPTPTEPTLHAPSLSSDPAQEHLSPRHLDGISEADSNLQAGDPAAQPGSSLELPLPAPDAPLELRIDGQRLMLEAREELELRCGDASITLRRDGLVLVRGVDLVSHARARNRIRGASVQIN